MSEQIEIKIGDNAPDFVLKDHNNNDVKLSDFKGKKVLLSFHPLAWTSICAKQMQSLEANKEVFKELNTIPLGMSVDTTFSKKAWADDLNIKDVKLLSDFWPHGEVSKSFGIFLEDKGFSARTNIIINEDQKIAFIKRYETGMLPDIQEIIDAVKSL